MAKEKEIKMLEIELEIDNETVKKLCDYALEEIKNDINALVNYAANKILSRKILEQSSETSE